MKQFQGAKVLVTGGNGFISSHLVDKLIELGAIVHITTTSGTDKQNVALHKLDIAQTDKVDELVKQIQPDFIFHLAGTIKKNLTEDEIMAINYVPAVKLLKSIEGINCRLIFPSAFELYADLSPPFNEDNIVKPITPYARSKRAVEMYCKKTSANAVCLRLAIVYGPRQKGDMFIPRIMSSCSEKREFETTSGEQTRDFVYISDAVEALLLAAIKENAKGEIINIASGKEYKIKDIALKVNELFGCPINIKFGAVPYRENEIWRYYGDITKAKHILNWNPKTELEKGLKETVSWWQARDKII